LLFTSNGGPSIEIKPKKLLRRNIREKITWAIFPAHALPNRIQDKKKPHDRGTGKVTRLANEYRGKAGQVNRQKQSPQRKFGIHTARRQQHTLTIEFHPKRKSRCPDRSGISGVWSRILQKINCGSQKKKEVATQLALNSNGH